MDILVLNGSPRPRGNTAALVDAFAEGAREAGHAVEVLDVARMDIAGCRGCEFCHTKGDGACAIHDDSGQRLCDRGEDLSHRRRRPGGRYSKGVPPGDGSVDSGGALRGNEETAVDQGPVQI